MGQYGTREERMIATFTAAYSSRREREVKRIERKPTLGIAGEYVDATDPEKPARILVRCDGEVERITIRHGTALYCAMMAKSQSQVAAIAKQYASLLAAGV